MKGRIMFRRRSPITHLITLVGFLMLALALSEPLAPVSEAAVGGCRADPIVILSDGTVLDISVGIGTAVSNVREIHYIVHGPRNVWLVGAISTPTLGFQGKETFRYYADAAPNQYITETLVQTTYNKVGVTAYTTFANITLRLNNLLTLQYKPINGFNDQILRALIVR
jgi:hypothetical protein